MAESDDDFAAISKADNVETKAAGDSTLDSGSHLSTTVSSSVDEDAATPESGFVSQGIADGEPGEHGLYYIQKHGLAVVVPPATRRWEYTVYDEPVVEQILDELSDEDEVKYLVRYSDETEKTVSF